MPGRLDGVVEVLVVDDHALVRSGMRRLLEDNAMIGHVEEASSGEEGLEIALAGEFDLVLMDISLPGMSGLEAAEKLMKRKPGTRIIMVTGKLDPGPVRSLLSSGVHGYVTKGSTSEEMEAAIRTVMGGKQYLSPDVAQQLAINTIHGEDGTSPFERLTARELEIIHMLLRGQRNRQISAALHISEKTVSTHRVRAFEKLEVSATAELVRLAMRHGLWNED
jgi:two-component system invasion response regulator UvrY